MQRGQVACPMSHSPCEVQSQCPRLPGTCLAAWSSQPTQLHLHLSFFSESAAPSGNRALPGTPASEPGVLTLFAQLGPLFHHLAPPRDSLQGLYDAYTWVYRYLRQSLAWWFRAWLLDQFWLCCMVLGKLSSFSGSQLPPLLSGDDNLWWGGPGI